MSDTAVLVVDMMNTYQHPDAEKLIPNVAEIIDSLTDLVVRAHDSHDVDLVYVNETIEISAPSSPISSTRPAMARGPIW